MSVLSRARARIALGTLILAVSALSTPSSAQELVPADRSAALEGAARSIALAVPSESIREPAEHYPTSNEWRHDLFFDGIRDLGGAFVGVGTDQCYTLAAAQDASLVWIVDYDANVAAVHRMYGALVRASPSPAELVARFERAREDETALLIAQDPMGDPAQAPEVVRTYRRNRGRFEGYLRHVARLARDGRPTSWLSDPALYARVRALFLAGRVIARTGDVTGVTTLRAVGAASQQLGVPVRVVYLSNAEQFFRYTEAFDANVRALPTDARTVVLRTFRHRRATYPDGDTWHYMVEGMPDFLERIALGYRRNTQIVSDAIRGGLGPTGITIVGATTPRQYATPQLVE